MNHTTQFLGEIKGLNNGLRAPLGEIINELYVNLYLLARPELVDVF